MIDMQSVQEWVRAYERAWRTAGTEQLNTLFAVDATYQLGPFQQPHRGLEAIRALWDAERAGPNETFEMDFDVVAVDGPRAVLRLDVRYGQPHPEHFRNIWILEFTPEGRCSAFEEWPFSAEHPAPHHAP
jgi:uncharacterized protein (TIGR02246 family)